MRLFTDYASSLTATSIAPGDSTIVLVSSGGVNFPSPTGEDFAVLSIEDTSGNIEKVKLTTRLGDTLTVVRGYEASLQLDFPTGSRVELRSTASIFNSFFQRSNGDTMDTGDNITFQMRRYTVTGEAPAVGDLAEGEMAINIPDRIIWTGETGADHDANKKAAVLLSAATSASNSLVVTQPAHGFTAHHPIYLDTDSKWKKAIANDFSTVGTHVISEVRTADVFVAQQVGEIYGFSGLPPGVIFYVSDTVVGGFNQYPSEYISNPMLLALNSTTAIVLGWRPVVLTPVHYFSKEIIVNADAGGLQYLTVDLEFEPGESIYDFALAELVIDYRVESAGNDHANLYLRSPAGVDHTILAKIVTNPGGAVTTSNSGSIPLRLLGENYASGQMKVRFWPRSSAGTAQPPYNGSTAYNIQLTGNDMTSAASGGSTNVRTLVGVDWQDTTLGAIDTVFIAIPSAGIKTGSFLTITGKFYRNVQRALP